jgi:hypothetical protein
MMMMVGQLDKLVLSSTTIDNSLYCRWLQHSCRSSFSILLVWYPCGSTGRTFCAFSNVLLILKKKTYKNVEARETTQREITIVCCAKKKANLSKWPTIVLEIICRMYDNEVSNPTICNARKPTTLTSWTNQPHVMHNSTRPSQKSLKLIQYNLIWLEKRINSHTL